MVQAGKGHSMLAIIILFIALLAFIHYSPSIGPWPAYTAGVVLIVIGVLVGMGQLPWA